ncbi:MAG TPA: ABC transporter ATP-binding protein [Thermoanaerobaculia bacterium]
MLDILRKLAALSTSRDRRDASLLLALTLIATALEAFAIWSVYPLIMTLLSRAGTDASPSLRRLHAAWGHPEQTQFLFMLLATVFVAYFLKNGFGALVAYAQNRFAFSKQTALARRLFEIYLRQPYTFHLQRNSAELIRNLVSESDQLIWTVFLPGVVLLAESLVALSLIALLFLVDPLSASIILGVFSVAGGSYYLLLRGRISRWGRQRLFHEGQRILHIQQGLGGIKEVKVLGRENFFLKSFAHHSSARTRSFSRYHLSGILPLLLLEVTGIASIILVLAISLRLDRPLELILPFLGMVAAAAFRLVPASTRTLVAFQQLRYGGTIVNNLHQEFRLGEAVTDIPAPAEPLVLRTSLRLDDVSFRYADRDADVFSGVNLEIRWGQTVGIIGASGGGKTTLVDVILGLLEPTAGIVSIDGRPLAPMRRSWQASIGYVPQHVFLTDDSMRHNVALGVADADIDEAAVNRAVDQARLRELVASLPRGLDTFTGERGVRLSGGQIQRIGIARALYHDPQVLVLDEATSSLDTSTESDIMDAIGKLRGEKTILIIAHRTSTVQDCDFLLRVESGKVTLQCIDEVK